MLEYQLFSVARPRPHDPKLTNSNTLGVIRNNIVNWLCIIGGKHPRKCKYTHPSDLEHFEEPWGNSANLSHMNFDLDISEKDILSKSKKEIFGNY